MKQKTLESNHNGEKLRGNAQQLVNNYMNKGDAAKKDGDNASAEMFYQHAEHYRKTQ